MAQTLSMTWMIPDLKQALQACDTPVFAKSTIDFLKKTVLPMQAATDDIATALYWYLGGEGALPRAALLALYYDLPPADAWLLCEPIELTEAKQDVVCLGNAHVDITQEEANIIVAKFNAYWEGSGMVLYAVAPKQWLLALPTRCEFQTRPLCNVLNQNLADNIPTGATTAWSHLFSLAQMLMHRHALNGLWMSGEGELAALEKKPHLCLMTDNPEVLMLARVVMAKTISVCENFDMFLEKYGSGNEEYILALSCEAVGAVAYEDYFEILENRWLKSYLAREKIPGITV